MLWSRMIPGFQQILRGSNATVRRGRPPIDGHRLDPYFSSSPCSTKTPFKLYRVSSVETEKIVRSIMPRIIEHGVLDNS
jgi:hypothetical protein